jgi:hypothetical protein
VEVKSAEQARACNIASKLRSVLDVHRVHPLLKLAAHRLPFFPGFIGCRLKVMIFFAFRCLLSCGFCLATLLRSIDRLLCGSRLGWPLTSSTSILSLCLSGFAWAGFSVSTMDCQPLLARFPISYIGVPSFSTSISVRTGLGCCASSSSFAFCRSLRAVSTGPKIFFFSA